MHQTEGLQSTCPSVLDKFVHPAKRQLTRMKIITSCGIHVLFKINIIHPSKVNKNI